MVYQFRRKVTGFSVVHMCAHFAWLGVFIYTLPDTFTRTELLWRLCFWSVLFAILAFTIRMVFLNREIRTFRRLLRKADASITRVLGQFDDFGELATAHGEYIKKMPQKNEVQEQLHIQADEMNLRLEKLSSDLENLKNYLHTLHVEQKEISPEIQQRLRQLESTYYYR